MYLVHFSLWKKCRTYLNSQLIDTQASFLSLRSVWNWRLMMKHAIKLGIKKRSNSTSFKIETYITTNVREQSVCECTNALLSPPLCPFSPPGCNLKLYTRVTALSRHRLCRWSLYLLRSFIKVWGNQRRGDAPQRFCPRLSGAPPTFLTSSKSGFHIPQAVL